MELIYRIEANRQTLLQKIVLGQDRVLQLIGGKELLYCEKSNMQYMVDPDNKVLQEIDLESYANQVKALKSSIGELNVDVLETGDERHIKVSNRNEVLIAFQCKAVVKKNDAISSIYKEYQDYQQSQQLFEIDIEEKELIMSLDSVLTVNGQEQTSNLKLIGIEREMSKRNKLKFEKYHAFKSL